MSNEPGLFKRTVQAVTQGVKNFFSSENPIQVDADLLKGIRGGPTNKLTDDQTTDILNNNPIKSKEEAKQAPLEAQEILNDHPHLYKATNESRTKRPDDTANANSRDGPSIV